MHLALRDGRPNIFNSDQRSQSAHDFTATLEGVSIGISMDGCSLVFDNIFVERLWRTVKYKDIYIKTYTSVPDLLTGLDD
jgi:putative transposase